MPRALVHSVSRNLVLLQAEHTLPPNTAPQSHGFFCILCRSFNPQHRHPSHPQGILRTREVLERLKSVAPQPGQKPPILVYLGVLLQKGKLNTLESTELAR